MKYQRTGLTEGTLIYNEWLKTFGLYRRETEDNFINWLYSISGWFDKDIKGTYFDIDAEKVRQSANYQRFLHEYHNSLFNSDMIHLMLHSDYYLNGLEHQDEFVTRFVEKPTDNYCYWKDVPLLKKLIKQSNLIIVNNLAPLIAEKYSSPTQQIIPIKTPQTQLNGTATKHKYKNSLEVLDDIYNQCVGTAHNKCVSITHNQCVGTTHKDEIFLISFGAYSCLLADKLNSKGYSTIVLGSGIQDLFPVKIPPNKLKLYRPAEYSKIEDGKYWKS